MSGGGGGGAGGDGGLLREYLWLWVVLVVLLVSFIIIVLFVWLNIWLRRKGKLFLGAEPRHVFVSEMYQRPNRQHVSTVPSMKVESRVQTLTPPLPPRTQFISEVSDDQSYENQDQDYENPDVEPDLGLKASSLPDYLEVETGPAPTFDDPEPDDEDYDDIDAEEDEDYDDVG